MNAFSASARVAVQHPSETPAVEPVSQVQMIEFDELVQASGVGQGARPLIDVMHPLRNVRTTLQVHIGSAAVTVGELMEAVEGQVLVLDRAVNHPVDLVLEGQVVARGQLVAVGDQFGVRITELPVALAFGKASGP